MVFIRAARPNLDVQQDAAAQEKFDISFDDIARSVYAHTHRRTHARTADQWLVKISLKALFALLLSSITRVYFLRDAFLRLLLSPRSVLGQLLDRVIKAVKAENEKRSEMSRRRAL